ncbi:HK97 family phage prohead protease [Streptomyces sp. NPDC015684]|uniref:HK97 family phage prohead protease n=1 Tax=Streptomyces sp. NPDC015684 TaxID=3364963 RepID=UPI0036FFB8E3
MLPERKTVAVHDVKANSGTVSAMFSVYSMIDSDLDVVLPGAIADGKSVVISAYNHSSWGPSLPVGKGVLRVNAQGAICDATFFKSQAAQDTFEVIQALGPLQQWSYGFNVLDSEMGEFQGRRVRFLKSLDVFEVSPVLLGANSAAHTVSVSPGKSLAEIRDSVMRQQLEDVRNRAVLRDIADGHDDVFGELL